MLAQLKVLLDLVNGSEGEAVMITIGNGSGVFCQGLKKENDAKANLTNNSHLQDFYK